MNFRKIINNKTVPMIGLLLMSIFIAHSLIFFNINKYLPPPFFFQSGDSFMDFFNVNWWSVRGGVYTEWGGFYAPINIWIGKLLTTQECYNQLESVDLRLCNLSVYFLFVLITAALTTFLLFRINKNIYLVIYLMLSMPMLYAVERGNYILLTMIPLSLFVIYKEKYTKFSNLLLSISIAFKAYLVILLAAIFLLEGSVKRCLAIVILYLVLNIVFGLVIDDSGWIKIPYNILSFQGGIEPLQQMWATTSIQGMVNYLYYYFENPVYGTIGSMISGLLKIYITTRLLIYTKEISSSNPDITHTFFIYLLYILILTSGAGYYSLIILYPFYLYCETNGYIKMYERILFLAALLPITFGIHSIKYYGAESIFTDENFYRYKLLPLEFIIVPILLLILFYRITRFNIYSKENK